MGPFRAWLSGRGRKQPDVSQVNIPSALLAELAALRIDPLISQMAQIDMLLQNRQLRLAASNILALRAQLAESQADCWLSLTLNLSYLLAIDIEVRAIVSPDEALPDIAKAIDMLRPRGDDHRLASALVNFAAVQLACEEGLVDAIQHRAMMAYDEAISLYEKTGDRHRLGQTYINRSEAYRRRPLGDVAENIRLARQDGESALSLLRGDDAGEARAHSVLGITAINDEQGVAALAWAEAVDHFETATELWTRCGAQDDRIEEQINLASARAEIARFTRNIPEALKACQLLEKSMAEAGERELAQQVLRAGTEFLVASAIVAQEVPFDDSMIASIVKRGENLLAIQGQFGRRSSAAAHIRGAIASFLIANAWSSGKSCYLDQAEPHLHSSTAAWARFEHYAKRANLYADFAAALDKIGEEARAKDAYEQARNLGGLQLAQALSLTASSSWSANLYRATIGLSCLLIRDGKPAKALEMLEEILGRSLRSDGNLQHGHALAALEQRERGPLEQRAAAAAVDALLAAKCDGESTSPAPDWAALASRLPAGILVLYPLVGPSSAHLLCTGRRDASAEPFIEAINWPDGKAAIDLLWATHPLDGRFRHEKVGGFDAALRHAGLSLGPAIRALIERHGLGKDSNLCLVAHGRFAAIPWHAISWDEDDGLRYLDGLGHFSLIPSLGWVLTERAIEPHNGITIIADPTEDLPGARVEQKVVAALFADRKPRLLVGEEATRAAVRSVFSKSRIVHVASHAFFDWHAPLQSALCLADGDIPIADLIVNEDFAPDLVVLSSCSSGVSNVARPGTEAWSFPWALHRRGIPFVIASQWPVVDLVTLLFFSHFYAHPAAMHAPAIALRSARRCLSAMSRNDVRAWILAIDHLPTSDEVTLLSNLDMLAHDYGDATPFASAALWAPITLTGWRADAST